VDAQGVLVRGVWPLLFLKGGSLPSELGDLLPQSRGLVLECVVVLAELLEVSLLLPRELCAVEDVAVDPVFSV
jgi:hypothetical protein